MIEHILQKIEAQDATVHLMRAGKAERYGSKPQWPCKIAGKNNTLAVETGFMKGETAADAMVAAWAAFEPAAGMVAPLMIGTAEPVEPDASAGTDSPF